MFNLMETLANFKRILVIAKKPSREEFIQTARICAIGISIVGAIGFVLFVLSVSVIG